MNNMYRYNWDKVNSVQFTILLCFIRKKPTLERRNLNKKIDRNLDHGSERLNK